MSQRAPFSKSLSHAIDGVRVVFRDEPNFRAHTILGFISIILGIILQISLTDWFFLIFTIFFVLIMELVNTALEKIVDMVSPEIRHEAKVAKDASAAAVLLGAFFAIAVGAIIFLPKIL